MKLVVLYMFGVHFSTNKAHITIHKFSLVFLYKRGCVPYLRHLLFGFVIFSLSFGPLPLEFTFGRYTLHFYFGIVLFSLFLKCRILFGFRVFGHTFDY